MSTVDTSQIPTHVEAATKRDPVMIVIEYESEEGKSSSSLMIEALGPNTAAGMVMDHIDGFYTESPDGQRVKQIRIARMSAQEPVIR